MNYSSEIPCQGKKREIERERGEERRRREGEKRKIVYRYPWTRHIN